MVNNTPVFLVHGLHGNTITNYPLQGSINKAGFNNVTRISYKTYHSIEMLTDIVMAKILETLDDNETEVIIIGHSLGGIVCRNLCKSDLNVKLCVMIASPQGGSHLIKKGREILNSYDDRLTSIAKYLLGDVMDDLADVTLEVPTVPYKTIGTAMPYMEFDGKVWADNMKIEDEHHHHIPNSGHSLILLDSRLHDHVTKLLQNHFKIDKSTQT